MQENNENLNKSTSALREEVILNFWKENNIFEKTLKKEPIEGEYVFYEGPPTANGKPGIHHLEARAFKDAIPRYKTMRGYHVRRKGGWDTHGLPVELQVEKKLGLNSKKAIEEYGVAKFNEQCKRDVWEYLDIWNKFTERIGFWVDQNNPYVTYHNNYIESVWNVFKHTYEQGLVYKDYRIVPWCPRCGTALSSHELAQGYEDVKDLSVYVKFKVKGQENTFILAWTTTPWTLPGNVALAVGEKIDYVKVKLADEILILAKSRISVLPEGYEIVVELKGSELIGLEYEPLYPFLKDTLPESEKPKLEKAYKVYGADFVTAEDGTGVVHTAVMYGQDDFALGNEIGLPKHHLVNPDGTFIKGTGFLEGRFVKEKDENNKPTLDVDIINDLTKKGFFFKKELYSHSYPHCWRCHTPLIYYARDSWYIRMSDEKIKKQLIEENKSINWEPAHIRDGRFGEWLKDIKDWAISRERYWGTPLPLYNCESCKKVQAIGSVEELKSKTKKSGNKYFVMRHGEAESNVLDILSSNIDNTHHLTEKGKEDVKKSADSLIDKKIDIIIASPFLRTKETSELVSCVINYPKENIIFDERIIEIQSGVLNGISIKEWEDKFPPERIFKESPEGGETLQQVKNRVGEFLLELESKYQNKNILIVSHGDSTWMMLAVADFASQKESIALSKHYFNRAEIRELNFIPLPHNENYELDLHRPYIDEVNLTCDCGGELVRTKEVMDVWFDSGCMPFAQDHYPFDPTGKSTSDGAGNKEEQKILYPADFICEAIDQTRGWFYTLHAIGVLMGRGKAYKNVICLGHILDDKGKKMSKSLGNIVDPWLMMDKYGVDTLRMWMYSVNQPGESKNFDEKTVSELHNKVFNLLYNVLAFYELYRDTQLENLEYKASTNILDQWIVARLNQLIENTTNHMDGYKLLEPVRDMRKFIDELSTWYVRRSRERLKDGDVDAKQTLYYVLKTLSKIMAPFAPFTSEDIWQKLKNNSDVESVHLSKWPKSKIGEIPHLEFEAIITMERIRDIVTIGLEARQKVGIKVRQPLHKIIILSSKNFDKEYVEILKDELNVKQVEFTSEQEVTAKLDTNITPELKTEGNYRELVRAIQDIRKKAGLNPNDIITLSMQTSAEGQKLINTFKDEILKTVSAKEINIVENQGTEIKIDQLIFKISFS